MVDTPGDNAGSSLLSDEPITSETEDRLGRAEFALRLSDAILTCPTEGGYVMGLAGPWGSGKSSLLNLVEEILARRDDVVVVRFNPWLFSGTEQLIEHFFHEISAQFRDKGDQRLHGLAGRLTRYGNALAPLGTAPVVGAALGTVGMVGKLAGKGMDRRAGYRTGTSVYEQRDALAEELAQSDVRVVVILDDIDRLTDTEIGDIVRLVRLTGNFPSLVYLLAFDRRRVEEALGDGDPRRGRSFLDKIIQVLYDLPQVPRDRLVHALVDLVNGISAKHGRGPSKQNDTMAAFHKVVVPLIATMRDVVRYVSILPLAFDSVGDEIALGDVLGMEGIRVFRPDVFASFGAAVEGLTTHTPSTYSPTPSPKEQVDAVLASDEGSEWVRTACELLFPASRQHFKNDHFGVESLRRWRRDRHVAHPDLLRFYLERAWGETTVTPSLITRAYSLLEHEQELEDFLTALSPPQAERVIQALEDFEDEFPPEAAIPATRVLLRQGKRLERPSRGFGDWGPRLAITRVVLRLLRRLPEETRESSIRGLLTDLDSFSERVELLLLVGHEPNAGLQLVSEGADQDERVSLATAILDADGDALGKEPDLDRVIAAAIKYGPAGSPARIQTLLQDDVLFLKLLDSAGSERLSEGVDDVVVHRSPRLPWSYLVELFEPDWLASRTTELFDAQKGAIPESLALAQRYADGSLRDDPLGPAEDPNQDE